MIRLTSMLHLYSSEIHGEAYLPPFSASCVSGATVKVEEPCRSVSQSVRQEHFGQEGRDCEIRLCIFGGQMIHMPDASANPACVGESLS